MWYTIPHLWVKVTTYMWYTIPHMWHTIPREFPGNPYSVNDWFLFDYENDF